MNEQPSETTGLGADSADENISSSSDRQVSSEVGEPSASAPQKTISGTSETLKFFQDRFNWINKNLYPRINALHEKDDEVMEPLVERYNDLAEDLISIILDIDEGRPRAAYLGPDYQQDLINDIKKLHDDIELAEKNIEEILKAITHIEKGQQSQVMIDFLTRLPRNPVTKKPDTGKLLNVADRRLFARARLRVGTENWNTWQSLQDVQERRRIEFLLTWPMDKDKGMPKEMDYSLASPQQIVWHKELKKEPALQDKLKFYMTCAEDPKTKKPMPLDAEIITEQFSTWHTALMNAPGEQSAWELVRQITKHGLPKKNWEKHFEDRRQSTEKMTDEERAIRTPVRRQTLNILTRAETLIQSAVQTPGEQRVLSNEAQKIIDEEIQTGKWRETILHDIRSSPDLYPKTEKENRREKSPGVSTLRNRQTTNTKWPSRVAASRQDQQQLENEVAKKDSLQIKWTGIQQAGMEESFLLSEVVMPFLPVLQQRQPININLVLLLLLRNQKIVTAGESIAVHLQKWEENYQWIEKRQKFRQKALDITLKLDRSCREIEQRFNRQQLEAKQDWVANQSLQRDRTQRSIQLIAKVTAVAIPATAEWLQQHLATRLQKLKGAEPKSDIAESELTDKLTDHIKMLESQVGWPGVAEMLRGWQRELYKAQVESIALEAKLLGNTDEFFSLRAELTAKKAQQTKYEKLLLSKEFLALPDVEATNKQSLVEIEKLIRELEDEPRLVEAKALLRDLSGVQLNEDEIAQKLPTQEAQYNYFYRAHAVQGMKEYIEVGHGLLDQLNNSSTLKGETVADPKLHADFISFKEALEADIASITKTLNGFTQEPKKEMESWRDYAQDALTDRQEKHERNAEVLLKREQQDKAVRLELEKELSRIEALAARLNQSKRFEGLADPVRLIGQSSSVAPRNIPSRFRSSLPAVQNKTLETLIRELQSVLTQLRLRLHQIPSKELSEHLKKQKINIEEIESRLEPLERQTALIKEAETQQEKLKRRISRWNVFLNGRDPTGPITQAIHSHLMADKRALEKTRDILNQAGQQNRILTALTIDSMHAEMRKKENKLREHAIPLAESRFQFFDASLKTFNDLLQARQEIQEQRRNISPALSIEEQHDESQALAVLHQEKEALQSFRQTASDLRDEFKQPHVDLTADRLMQLEVLGRYQAIVTHSGKLLDLQNNAFRLDAILRKQQSELESSNAPLQSEALRESIKAQRSQLEALDIACAPGSEMTSLLTIEERLAKVLQEQKNDRLNMERLAKLELHDSLSITRRSNGVAPALSGVIAIPDLPTEGSINYARICPGKTPPPLIFDEDESPHRLFGRLLCYDDSHLFIAATEEIPLKPSQAFSGGHEESSSSTPEQHEAIQAEQQARSISVVKRNKVGFTISQLEGMKKRDQYIAIAGSAAHAKTVTTEDKQKKRPVSAGKIS